MSGNNNIEKRVEIPARFLFVCEVKTPTSYVGVYHDKNKEEVMFDVNNDIVGPVEAKHLKLIQTVVQDFFFIQEGY